MTARHQIRVGSRRIGRERTAIDAAPAPTVGELLAAAREKKGVDLYRAERDTKIRARHLAALESGDYAELPGAVYTKGFLRNYALYVGLDPDELLLKWRDEQELARATEALEVAPPPTPLAEPRRGLTFTPGIFVAALLSFVVLLFLGYVGLQVVRFSQETAVVLDGAPVRTLRQNATEATITGTSSLNATINVLGSAGDIIRTVHANGEGRWSVEVPVTRGENRFSIVARDAATQKESPPVDLILTVPLPATPRPEPSTQPGAGSSAAPVASRAPTGDPVTPAPDSGPGPAATQSGPSTAEAAKLALRAPADRSRFNGLVPVSGDSNAPVVRITAVYQGRVGAPVSSTPPDGGPREPEPVRLRLEDGSFADSLPLAPGRWTVTVETQGTPNLAAASVTRIVDVAYTGVMVTIEARGGNAWLQIWVDDELIESGKTYHRGDQRTVMARRTVVVNTGNEAATHVTVNGEAYGALSPSIDVGTWVFEKGKQPRALR